MDSRISWSSVCRLCDKTSRKMLNIFDKNQEGMQILNVIRDTLDIIVYRTDPLSKNICDLCYEKLNIVHKFKKQVSNVVEKQKLQLVENGPSVKTQLYLNLLESQNMVDDVESSSRDVSSVHMNDMSTITDQSFLFEQSQKLQEDLESVNSMLVEIDSANLNDTLDNNDMMTESDMEICDPTETPQSKIIVTKRKRKIGNFGGPACKKRRVIGPKSRVPSRVKTITEIRYNPHSLLKCAIDVFNKQNVPDFDEKCYDKVEIVREEVIHLCNYCGVAFDTPNELAVHELNGHIRLDLERVDSDGYWSSSESNADVRNNWYMNTQPTEIEEISTEDGDDVELETEDDLLIPLEDTKSIFTGRSSNIVFINEQPTLNGISLMSVPKDKRGDFYQSVRLNGVRRKFCNLCRYTFKDNWAIELHYMSRTCYYSCNYCGIKFNKNKYAFAKHIDAHKLAGDKKSEKVFVNKTKSGTVPRELSLSAMKPYVPIPNRYVNKVKPIKMKSLLEKKKVNPTTLKIKSEVQTTPAIKKESKQKYPPPMTTADLANSENKAYFCKKCYQVFCKLNEYNDHNKICTGEKPNDPEMNVIRHYHKKEKFNTETSPYKPVIVKKTPIKTKIENNVEVYSSTGRPVRHCVREVSYSDDKEPEFKPTVPIQIHGQYECTLCSSVFASVHSRNSHMRIHKTGFKPAARSPVISPNLNQLTIKHEPKSNNPIVQKKIKQETYEPIVEIHEGHSSKVPSSIGSVSITPLNVNKKNNKVSPAIMQLVQNNPNITIKTKSEIKHLASPVNDHTNNISPATPDFERSYKCSSCSQQFANKSNLYFHKKNQCGGSKYPCPFCKKRFGTEATYSSHIFYSHPV